MTFQVQHTIPYEGANIEDFETLDEAVKYIIECKLAYDDVQLVEVKYLDVYSVMAAKRPTDQSAA